MWYQASSFPGDASKIAYATSSDGISWAKHGVVWERQSGTWYSASVSSPSVIPEGQGFRMFFGGVDSRGVGRIGHVHSGDGLTWDSGSAVIDLEPEPETWERTGLVSPRPLVWACNLWLFFAGGGAPGQNTRGIGAAFIRSTCESKGDIVFEARQTDLDRSIYHCRPDGTGLAKVVSSADVVQPSRPTWSPDGKLIAFDGGGAAGTDIWVSNRDGTGLTNLTRHHMGALHPHFSPDGKRIAFSTGSNKLYAINADGSNLTYLSPGCHPRWSPDGTKLIFSNWGVTYDSDLFVLDTETGQVTQLTFTPGARETFGDWSPDASKIAFELGQGGSVPSDIWVMNADGADRRNLTGTWNGSAVDETPAWSPDGKYVAFASDCSGNFDIWVIKTDRTDPPQRVTSAAIDERNPDWIAPLRTVTPMLARQWRATLLYASPVSRALDVRPGGGNLFSFWELAPCHEAWEMPVELTSEVVSPEHGVGVSRRKISLIPDALVSR